MKVRTRGWLPLLLVAACAGGCGSSRVESERTLRVCADPNNLPFSNEKEEGFENRLARMMAEELGADLSYTWWAQHAAPTVGWDRWPPTTTRACAR